MDDSAAERFIGLMSGTSIDAVDGVLVRFVIAIQLIENPPEVVKMTGIGRLEQNRRLEILYRRLGILLRKRQLPES